MSAIASDNFMVVLATICAGTFGIIVGGAIGIIICMRVDGWLTRAKARRAAKREAADVRVD